MRHYKAIKRSQQQGKRPGIAFHFRKRCAGRFQRRQLARFVSLANPVAGCGHAVLFIIAGQLLDDLAVLDRDSALRRRLKHYTAPDLLEHDILKEINELLKKGLGVDLPLLSNREKTRLVDALIIGDSCGALTIILMRVLPSQMSSNAITAATVIDGYVRH